MLFSWRRLVHKQCNCLGRWSSNVDSFSGGPLDVKNSHYLCDSSVGALMSSQWQVFELPPTTTHIRFVGFDLALLRSKCGKVKCLCFWVCLDEGRAHNPLAGMVFVWLLLTICWEAGRAHQTELANSNYSHFAGAHIRAYQASHWCLSSNNQYQLWCVANAKNKELCFCTAGVGSRAAPTAPVL